MAMGMRLTPFILAITISCAKPHTDSSTAILAAGQTREAANTNVTKEVIVSSAVRDLLAQSDRTDADRALDARKQSAELLTFLDVKTEMRVAELGCGNGHLTDLIVRSVGSKGLVFAQNAPGLVAPAVDEAWRKRFDGRPNVVHVNRGPALPLPMEARELDLVYLGAEYGRLTALGVDREAMNHSVQLALKRGGRYVVLDHTLPPISDTNEAHREESRSTRREIESAGFTLVSEGRFFRTSTDPREWQAPPEAAVDVFVLAFVKP